MNQAPWAQQWLDSVPATLTRLRERAVQLGVPNAGQFDLSPQSLLPLWAWARRRLTPRPPDQPVDVTALPVWFGDPAAWTPWWWDDDSIWLADGLIAYIAETMRNTHPGARWEIWQDPSPWGSPYDGQPVLVGVTTQPWQPWTHVPNLVGRIWAGTATDQDVIALHQSSRRSP